MFFFPSYSDLFLKNEFRSAIFLWYAKSCKDLDLIWKLFLNIKCISASFNMKSPFHSKFSALEMEISQYTMLS